MIGSVLEPDSMFQCFALERLGEPTAMCQSMDLVH